MSERSNMVRLVVLVPEDMREDLETIREAQKRSVGAVTRSAVAQYVAAWKRQNEAKEKGKSR